MFDPEIDDNHFSHLHFKMRSNHENYNKDTVDDKRQD